MFSITYYFTFLLFVIVLISKMGNTWSDSKIENSKTSVLETFLKMINDYHEIMESPYSDDESENKNKLVEK